MSERAEVTSIDAIADFRNSLLIYISKVRPLLDDSADEVFRTREWLRVEQRLHWENQMRLRTRQLADAQQALFSAELAKLRPPSSAEVSAVHTARRSLAAAEEKTRTVKRLASSFEKEAVPRLKQIESLRSVVATDLRKAVHFLERIVGALEHYTLTNIAPVASTESQIHVPTLPPEKAGENP